MVPPRSAGRERCRTDGTVEYRLETADANEAEVQVVLPDAGGVEVVTSGDTSGTLRVPSVHGWAPGDGYL